MKELTEINERLDSQDEVIDNLVKTTTQLEKREVKFPEINIPDYSGRFEELKQQVKSSEQDYLKHIEELKFFFRQQNLEYKAQLQGQLGEVKKVVEQIPKVIPVKHYYHFNLKTKGWITGAIILFIVVAIATGLCFYLSAENSRFKANDLKFRMVRQAYPAQANWAEATYDKNPQAMQQLTEKLENQAKERKESADVNGQKKRGAQKAKAKLIRRKRNQLIK